jgi:hypothetical protein
MLRISCSGCKKRIQKSDRAAKFQRLRGSELAHMNKIKLTLIFGLINLVPVFIDLISIHFGSYESSISRYAPMTLNEIIGYSVYSFIYTLIFSLSFYLIAPKFYLVSIKTNHSGFLGAIKIARFVYAFCLLASLMVLFDIFRQDVISYLISTRSGKSKVGALIYFVLICFPIAIGVLLHKKGFTRWAALGGAVLVVLNLVTGFRILLFWGGGIVILLHYRKLIGLNRYLLVFLGFVFGLLMYGYQEYRELAQGVLDGSGRGIFDSLNRSVPLHTIKLAWDSSISVDLVGFFELLVLPLTLLMSSVFGLNELQVVIPGNISEGLYSSYIFWRDGFYGEASGFSINSLSFSAILIGGAGVFVMPIFSAVMCSLGISLYRSGYILERVAGSLLIVFTVFSMMESFVEAWKLLVYSGIFIVLMLTACCLYRVVLFGSRCGAVPANIVQK